MAAEGGECRLVSFDLSVYSLDVVKKAAYRFVDRFSLEIVQDGGKVDCTISFRPHVAANARDECLADFHAEVLDQDLRETVARETAAARNAILALAFSPITSKSNEQV